ncbi:MAG TPA: hypothetical protein VLF17_04330 [Candidatus Nitrosotenuis sp.]|nr:hypothetical protein [Candidatus Nitrosotenuis sp.]
MNVNYKLVFLSFVIVFLFASIYTSVGLTSAQAAKHNLISSSGKAKKGLIAQKYNQYLEAIKAANKKK